MSLLSDRTYARRKASQAALSPEESDRVMRLYRLLGRTEAVLGSEDHARRWLSTPNRGLGGRSPLELAATETGAALVFDLLGQIEHGVFS